MNEPQEERKGLFESPMLPDINTAEAVRYGSAYEFLKNSQWLWSAIEDYLTRKLRGLQSQIMDPEFAYYIITQNPSVLRTPTPPFKPDQNRDIFTLRDYARVKGALMKLPEFRKKNELWARKQALKEYIRSFRERGEITPEDWKACNNRYNMEPITYDFVKGKAREQMEEETIDWPTFVEAMFSRQEDPVDEVPEDISEEIPPEPVEEDDMTPVQEFVLRWLEDPVSRALSRLEDKDDALNAAYSWLSLSEFDPRDIVDRLLLQAEAVR